MDTESNKVIKLLRFQEKYFIITTLLLLTLNKFK